MTSELGRARKFGLVAALAIAIGGGFFGAILAVGAIAPRTPAAVQLVQRASDAHPVVPITTAKVAKTAKETTVKATSDDDTTTTEVTPTTAAPETSTTEAPPTTTAAVTTTTAAPEQTTTTEASVTAILPPLPPVYSGPPMIPTEVLTVSISDPTPTVGEAVTLTASLVDVDGNPVGISSQQWGYLTAPDGVGTGVQGGGSGGSLPTTSLDWDFAAAGTYEIQCAVAGTGPSLGGYDAIGTITVTVTD